MTVRANVGSRNVGVATSSREASVSSTTGCLLSRRVTGRNGCVADIVAGVTRSAAPGLRDLLFVACLTTVLTIGVLGVLLLNTAMQQQSDRLTQQHQKLASLTDQAQQLRTRLDRLADPATLAAKARQLHMQPVTRLHFTSTGVTGTAARPARPARPAVSRSRRAASSSRAG
jgi:hypothetical protein